MKIRFFDLVFSFLGLMCFSPLFLVIYVILLFDTGKPFFIQARVGKKKKIFYLIKFRTMQVQTKSIASHLCSESNITKVGKILRKTKIDELPQLFNVFKGEMSLVGPRPNLPNQKELIVFREKHNVYNVLPGITGLAQIQNIDMSMPKQLSETDARMIKNFTIKRYFLYIFRTITGSGLGDAIKK